MTPLIIVLLAVMIIIEGPQYYFRLKTCENEKSKKFLQLHSLIKIILIPSLLGISLSSEGNIKIISSVILIVIYRFYDK